MKHDDRIKFRFDKLTIIPYDLVLGEGLFIEEQITFFSAEMVFVFQHVLRSSYKSSFTVKVKRCNVEVMKLVGN